MKKMISGMLAVSLAAACLPAGLVQADSLTTINGYQSEIRVLMDACHDAGIPTDYEAASLEILNRYVSELSQKPVMAEYVTDACERIGRKTVTDLKAYLAGEKQAFSAVALQNEPVRLLGKDFVGTVLKDGETIQQPVFLNGAGHWKQIRKDLDFLERAGLNYVQSEVSMSEVLREPNPADNWEIVRQIEDTTIVSQSSDWSMRGSYSLCMKDENTDWRLNKLTMVHQKVAVEPSTKYNYLFYVKRKNVPNFWFSVKGKTLKDGCYIRLNQTGEDSSRVLYQGSYTTGADETELDISFVNELGADYIYIDAVALYKDGTTTNLIQNFSFENHTDTGFGINQNVIDEVRSFLEDAEAHHIKVDLLISTHNKPAFLSVLYPELEYSGYGFFSYDPLLETSRQMIKTYLTALMTGIKDCTALNSICLSNEPSFISAYEPERYNPAWREWLINKYQIIENLNDAYQSSYGDFAELDLSEIFTIGRYNAKHPMYADYKSFNEELFAGWHAWVASVVKAVIPDVLVHSKTLNYILGPEDIDPGVRSQMFNGANYELFAEFSDVNGCDSGGTLTTPQKQFIMDMHYDLFESIKKAPVVNSENHIVSENSHHAAQFVYSATWQGAVHGLGASSVWIWDNQYEYAKQENHFDALLQLKPEHLWKLSRATMDLNRLSAEVSALRNADAEVAILYSETARIYSESYLNSVYKAYKAVQNAGERVHFITDTNPEIPETVRLVIVPDAVCVPDGVLDTLAEFDGIKLVLGKQSLSKNEKNQNRDTAAVSQALSGAGVLASQTDGTKMTVPTQETLEYVIGTYVKRFGRTVSVTETDTGDIPSEVSWMSTQHNGKKLVNLCNYGTNPVALTVSGSERWKNLITGEVMKKTLVAEPNVPLLLEETNAAVTKRDGIATSKRLPVTPILKYRSGYKISWVNPDNAHIKKASVYRVDASGAETLVSDTFSTDANAVCSYHDNGTHNGAAYFKILLEFNNASPAAYVLGGVMNASLGGDWSATVNNRSDQTICYQYETGYTRNAHSGNYALSFAANFNSYDSSYVNIKAKNGSYSVEEGKSYRVSFWMQADHVSSLTIKPSILPEKRIIQRIADIDYFPEIRSDWRYYYYDTTAPETATVEGDFRIVFDEMANACTIDDVSIYEIGADGEPTGENLLPEGDFENLDAADCGSLSNLQIIKTDAGTRISWQEPANSNFSAVRLSVNGQQIGKLAKGVSSILLPGLESGDVVSCTPVDVYGIAGKEIQYAYLDYPVKFTKDGAPVAVLKAGENYGISSKMTSGTLYMAFFGADMRLLQVVCVGAETASELTVPQSNQEMYLKTFIWNDAQTPLENGRIWEIQS